MTDPIQQWQIPKEVKERESAIRQLFPHACKNATSQLAPNFRGGRAAAITKLHAIDGEAYGKNRNFLNGNVTHLSPYIRHGCITITEAVTFVREHFGQRAEKLLFEFAWHEYWRLVWYEHKMNILQDMQAPKVELATNDLADDVLTGQTGLPCMDDFIHQLSTIGYLHNHARMWLASYIVHWRKMDWQTAAHWMHNQLLDGNYASNHLSWQWVASTFSSKPYFFNQENLAKYTHHQYCNRCTASCPFKSSYAHLEQQLFRPTQQPANTSKPIIPIAQERVSGNHTIVFINDEMLNSEHSLLQLPHDKIYILDPNLYQDWSILRLQFIADCLAEMPDVEVWIGKTSKVLAHLNVGTIITQETPNDLIKQPMMHYSTIWHKEARVYQKNLNPSDLKSFSRFWKIAGPTFTGHA